MHPVNEYSAAVAALLAGYDDTIPHLVGRRNLYTAVTAAGPSQGLTPPRYVWIVTRDTATGNACKSASNPRAFEEQKVGIEIHCWGAGPQGSTFDEDYDAAWQMSRNVLAALKQTLTANWSLEACGFLAERDDWKWKGQVYVVGLAIDVPVVDVIVPTVEIQGTDHTMTIQLSTEEEAGC